MAHRAVEDAVERVGLRYRRMSFDDSAEQLNRQATDIEAICTLHDYITKPEWLYTDEDESGNEQTRYRQGKGERPGLAAMDRELHVLTARGRAVAVVAWVPSRLFRDAGHKEKYFSAWARAGDVVIHTKQGVWNPRDPRDRFVSTMVAGADQYYSDDVREKVERAHMRRVESGYPAVGPPGFGHRHNYALDPKTGGRVPDGTWCIDGAEAKLIRKAMADIIAGKKLIEILREWTERKVPTRNGGQWRLTTLRKLFTSPRLAGMIVRRDPRSGETIVVGRGSFPAIVDDLTFKRVSRVLGGRQQAPHAKQQLLTGLLRCGSCGLGQHLNCNWKGSAPRTRIYGCRACGGCNINADAVERVVEQKFFELLDDKRFIQALSRDDSAAEGISAELDAIEEEIAALEAVADQFSVAAYLAKDKALQARKADAEERLTRSGAFAADMSWLTNMTKLRSTWSRRSTDEKRRMLEQIVGEIEVLPGRPGVRATDDVVKARLRPLRAATAGTSPRRPR